MKKLLAFFLLSNLLFSFEVEFTKVYKKYILPNKEAIEIITSKNNLTFPFKYIKTENGYILIGNIDDIDLWLRNYFYAPQDAKFKKLKIAVVDMDEIQYKIINKIKRTYKGCSLKKLIFLTPDEEKIITKPTYVETNYKIILECK
ncbi:MAG: hypothetical protein ABGX25_05870 [Nautiliaceae bacterium]